jgi:pyruvate dehydrogenase E1 component beta subunit
MRRAELAGEPGPDDEGRTRKVEVNLVTALNLAMDHEMAVDERVMVIGQDVGWDGGIFRVTDGLIQKYGEHRVVDTPISEMAIAGACTGLAIGGMRPIGEFQFSGFSYQAAHHFESHVSRYRKRSQGRYSLPLVFRLPYGAGVRALEHHSESKEAYWAHTPGLKVWMPSGPRLGYEMLRAAIRDPDPVMFMEPKYLYRRFKEEFEVGHDVEIPTFDAPQVVREGSDVTIVAWGAMFHRAANAAATLAEERGIECELIDLQVVSPYDHRKIHESVRKTGRLVVFHEAHRSLGLGAEISARIGEDEETFYRLEAPMVRVTAPDVVVPLLAREHAYMPDEGRLVEAVAELMEQAG